MPLTRLLTRATSLPVGRALTAAVLGDSIDAQNTTDGTATGNSAAIGYWTWAQIYSGHRWRLILNAGVGGETASQIAARVGQVVAARPTICIVGGGTNDASNIDPATVIPAKRATYAALTAAGIYVVDRSILPRPAAGTTSQKNIETINRWCWDYWRENGGGELCDMFSVLTLPTTTTQSLRSTFLLSDNTHPGMGGAQLMGKKLGARLLALAGGAGDNGLIANQGQTNFSSNKDSAIFDRALIDVTTGGLVFDAFTGTMPSGFSVSGTGGGVASVVASPTGTGNAIQVAATGSADGQTVIVGATTALMGTGKLAVGDDYYTEMWLEIASPVKVKSIESYTLSTGAAASVTGALMAGSNDLEEGFSGVVRSPIRRVAVGTTALSWNALHVKFSGSSASCTIRIAQITPRKYRDPAAIYL